MPWQEQSKMSLKAEFVALAEHPDANLSALCRQFGISRPTGYQLLPRYRADGVAGLAERLGFYGFGAAAHVLSSGRPSRRTCGLRIHPSKSDRQ